MYVQLPVLPKAPSFILAGRRLTTGPQSLWSAFRLSLISHLATMIPEPNLWSDLHQSRDRSLDEISPSTTDHFHMHSSTTSSTTTTVEPQSSQGTLNRGGRTTLPRGDSIRNSLPPGGTLLRGSISSTATTVNANNMSEGFKEELELNQHLNNHHMSHMNMNSHVANSAVGGHPITHPLMGQSTATLNRRSSLNGGDSDSLRQRQQR